MCITLQFNYWHEFKGGQRALVVLNLVCMPVTVSAMNQYNQQRVSLAPSVTVQVLHSFHSASSSASATPLAATPVSTHGSSSH